MPRDEPPATPSGFFALRTPLLPYDVLETLTEGLAAPRATAADLAGALDGDRALVRSRLRALALDPTVREALFLASPSLDEALDAWLADEASARARGVAEIVLRYVGRMAARATPFGLFSGCSLGALSAATRFELAPRASYRRSTRLDAHYLSALCDALARDPDVRASLTYRPSTGLYRAAGQVRYAEGRTDPATRARSYHLVSVEPDAALEVVLARARGGARPSELVDTLRADDPTLARDEAAGFVDAVIDAQLLTSDLAPPLTGDAPIDGVLRALDACGAAPEVASRLRAAGEEVAALDDAVGHPAARYHAVAGALRALPAEVDLARLFQVDLHKPVAACALGGAALREVEGALRLLVRTAVPAEDGRLRRFREAFTARYEGRAVPVAEALDEESGVGFAVDGGEGDEPSPLLEGMDLRGDPAPPKVTWGPRAERLGRGIADAVARGAIAWELDDDDLAALTASGTPELPRSFALLVSLLADSDEALARGDLRVVVNGLFGPSGVNLLGRFCHADPALRAHVEAHLRAEEENPPSEGAVFAEVVHLPEGRLGNILCRPTLRPYEIPYLGRPSVDDAHLLPITDLRVAVRGGRAVLQSDRLGREVVPRLTSAHNHPAAALGVYRFLCALQNEGQAHAFGWHWGPHAEAPFLPRVTRGRVVLSLARWNLDARALRPLADAVGAPRYQAALALRRALRLPRRVGVVDGDNVLPLDLDSALHVDALARVARSLPRVTLVEWLAGEGAAVRGPEGRFVHELVIPFVRASKAPPPRAVTPRVTAVKRTFPPGGEWLYAKLYAGAAGADRALVEVVAPVLDAARAEGALDRWFFLRYADPEWHLRLRLRADPARLWSVVLPRLHDVTAPLLDDGRLARVSLDTYEREVERYGGSAGVELAEAAFEADSEAALAIVRRFEGEGGADARWRLALRGVHGLLVDLGLDLDARHRVMVGMRDPLVAERALGSAIDRQLGARYRAERLALEALLATSAGDGHPLDAGLVALVERSRALAPVVAELRGLAAAGRLSGAVADLAPSLVHLHVNRVLRAEHRAHELVVYDLLARLYQSRRARGAGG